MGTISFKCFDTERITRTLRSLCIVTFILIIQLSYIYTATPSSYGLRNTTFDGIYKTDNELISLKTKSELVCFMSCTNNPHCVSISYNSETGVCQQFSDVLSDKSVTGVVQSGIQHYDLVRIRDCTDVPRNLNSGVYNIHVCDHDHYRFEVYCDMETDGGGWTVLMRRIDGSENFTRNWDDYEKGFGVLLKEFWLGNKQIHRITASGNYQLRVDLEDFEGNKVYAKYAAFGVGNAGGNYKLSVGGYTGSAGDAHHNGRPFTTFDKDNDEWLRGNCATHCGGGWWYMKCLSTLTAHYGTDRSYNMRWLPSGNLIKTATMMIRRL